MILLACGRNREALGATILGMPQPTWDRMGRIPLFPLLFQNGCSQSYRFLPQARRIVGSGDRNVDKVWTKICGHFYFRGITFKTMMSHFGSLILSDFNIERHFIVVTWLIMNSKLDTARNTIGCLLAIVSCQCAGSRQFPRIDLQTDAHLT